MSLYYPYYHALMISLGYCHISGRMLLLDLLFGFLGPIRDVSVAFVIRRGGALWRISELQSQLINSLGEIDSCRNIKIIEKSTCLPLAKIEWQIILLIVTDQFPV